MASGLGQRRPGPGPPAGAAPARRTHSRGGAALQRNPSRRPRRRRQPRPVLPAQTSGEARPGPAGRLALDFPAGPGSSAGSLGEPALSHPETRCCGWAWRPASTMPGAAWPSPTGGWHTWPDGTAPSVGVARRRWSVAPLDSNAAPDWRNVSGGRSRQLLRNIEHTAAVHGFIAALSVQARALGREIVQLDPAPPGLAAFPSRRRPAPPSTPTPSASSESAASPGPSSWSGSAAPCGPTTMSQRLAPYLRYYSTRRPTDDHGIRPAVLVVFDDDLAATHFLMLAEREMARAGVGSPPAGLPAGSDRCPGAAGTGMANTRRMGTGLPASSAIKRPYINRGWEQIAGLRSIPDRRGRSHVPTTYQLRTRPPEASWDGPSSGSTRRRCGSAWHCWAAPRTGSPGRSGSAPATSPSWSTRARAPSGCIRQRMLKALGADDFHQLFTLEGN